MPSRLADTTQLGIDLAYVHAHGVIHRDIKPANVLLDEHHHPHLSDFGIATMADSTQITHTGLMIGTAAYLSPEQVRGHPVGPAADIYALGLVLIECLTGQREYPGQPMEAALARLHRQPHVPQDLPTPMPAVLQAMTAADPDQRPTAAEVCTWLREDTPPTAGATRVLGAPPPPVPLERPRSSLTGPTARTIGPCPGHPPPPQGTTRRSTAARGTATGPRRWPDARPTAAEQHPRPHDPHPRGVHPLNPARATPAPIPSPPDTPSTEPSPNPTAEQPAATQAPATRTQPSPNTPAAQPVPPTSTTCCTRGSPLVLGIVALCP